MPKQSVSKSQKTAWLKLLGNDPSDKTLRLFDTALAAGFRPATAKVPVCTRCVFGRCSSCIKSRKACGVYTDGCFTTGLYWVRIGEYNPADAVLKAAAAVVKCWEGGDLAAAVRELAEELKKHVA